MVRRQSVLVILLLAGMALAGCVQGADSGGDLSDRSAGIDEDKGSIVGLVTDDAFTPLAGVQVGVLEGAGEVVTTDEQGQFELRNLEPGKYSLAANKLGYESVARIVNVALGEITEVQLTLEPKSVAEPFIKYLEGDGYFSCGAYLILVTWGNLHACAWDNHEPRYFFEVDKEGIMGIMQELVWEQTSALTSEQLITYLQYKPVCDPFCEAEREWEETEGTSPIRNYLDFEDDADDFEEDPIPLNSMTFPGGDETPVIVFQQRMKHYITLFYNAHGDLDTHTGIPDA